jgi:hypothetical protein
MSVNNLNRRQLNVLPFTMSERGPGHDKLRNTAQQAEKQSAGKGRVSGVKGSGKKESGQ